MISRTCIAIANVLVLVSLFAINHGNASGKGTSYDFRNTTWGMSRLDVILAEDRLPNWDDSSGGNRQIGFRFTSFDDDPLIDYLREHGIEWIVMDIRYELTDDRLVYSEVGAYPPLINDANFDYELLYELVSAWVDQQHGNGHYVEHWRNGPKEGDKVLYIYLDELKRETSWLTDRSIIRLEQAAHVHLGTEIIRTRITYMDRSLTGL